MSANAPLTKHLESSQILHVFNWCEKAFVSQIGGGFNGQVDNVLAEIKKSSEGISDYNEKQIYSKMYETLVANKYQMHHDFNIFLKKYFHEKITSQQVVDSFDYSKLAIITDEEFEKNIQSKALETKISDAMGEDFSHLSTRMGFLLGNDKNPFSPDILASALTATLQKILNDATLQKQIVQIFSASWPEAIRNTYRGMNKYLIANDVIVDVKAYQKKILQSQEQDTTKEKDSKHTPSSIVNSEIDEAPISPQDIMKTLAQMFQNQAQFIPNSNSVGVSTQKFNFNNINNISEQTMQSINELQKAITLNNKVQNSSLTLANLLQDKLAEPAHFNNIIKGLSPQTENQFDQLIIEIVSTVFDKIFCQTNVPEHIKFLIGKLQIPLLKNALCNKKLFLQKDNSARLFLDRLANNETIYNTEYLNKLEVIIDDLLVKNEITSEIFLIALENLEKLIAEQKSNETNIIAKSSIVLENDERSGLFVDQITEFTNKKTDKVTYEPVRTFIDNIWAPQFSKKWTPLVPQNENHFIQVLNGNAEAKMQLNHALLIFDMIIWSTQIENKTTENVAKLSQYIPKIREGLSKICKDANISAEDTNNLIFLLSEKHLAIIQKEDQQKKVHEQNITNNEQKIVESYKNKNKSQREVLKAQNEISQNKVNFDDIFVQGQWFSFLNEKIKMKLLWVSPGKTLFLFNNLHDKKVYRFDKAIIWNKFKNKTLTSLFFDKIDTEELVNSVVNELNYKIC